MKSNYAAKLEIRIHGDIIQDTYIETTDNMLKELSRFQEFLYKYKRYIKLVNYYQVSFLNNINNCQQF